MHIHFPYLIVDAVRASQMAKAIAAKLHELYGLQKQIKGGFSRVVDSAPYKTGLRMVGSRKCKTCDLCRAVNSSKCERCNGLGKLCCGNVYKPFAVFQGKERIMDHPALTREFDMVKMCTIRSTAKEPTPGWRPCRNVPSADTAQLARAATQLATVADAKTDRMRQKSVLRIGERWTPSHSAERARQRAHVGAKIRISERSPIFAEVQDAIRHYNKAYANVLVSSLHKAATGRYYIANLIGRGRHRCLNLLPSYSNGCHGGVTAYFYITKYGLYQRCYCQHTTTEGRVNGRSCKEYRGDQKEIPERAKMLRASFCMATSSLDGARSLLETDDGVNSILDYVATRRSNTA